MATTYDKTGMRFGKLLVLGKHHVDGARNVHYRCQCDCGNIIVIRSSNIASFKGCECMRPRRQYKDGEPRKDCTAYEDDTGGCRALNEMMCVTRGKCKFFKARES